MSSTLSLTSILANDFADGMRGLSRLVKQLSLGPDLFFIARTRHLPLLFTTTKPDTLLKWRQISVSAISYDGRLVEVPVEKGVNRRRSSGVKYRYRKNRRTLPKELLRNVVVLTCKRVGGGTCSVYLVGTSHFTQESREEVQGVISHLRPEVVFLELCSNRVDSLKPRSQSVFEVPTKSEMIDQWKEKHNPFSIMWNYSLKKGAAKRKDIPDSEFRVAYEEAKKWGSKVILGDRPNNVTVQRSWGKLPLWHRTILLGLCLSGADVNLVSFPTVRETVSDERDQYMSSTLLRVASQHHSVVAVVGKGHLQGIKKYWMQPVEMEKLMEIPSTSKTISTRKIVKSLGVAAVGVAIIAGVYLAA